MKLIPPLLSGTLSLLVFCCPGNHLYAINKPVSYTSTETVSSPANLVPSTPDCASVVQLNWKQGEFPNGLLSYDFNERPSLSGPETVTLHQGDTLSVSIENPRNDVHFGSFDPNEIDIASDSISVSWESWLEGYSDILKDFTSNYTVPVRFTRSVSGFFYPFLNDETPLTFYFLGTQCGEATITFNVSRAQHTQDHAWRVSSSSRHQVSYFTLTVTVL